MLYALGYLLMTVLVVTVLCLIQLYLEKDHIKWRMMLALIVVGFLWPIFMLLVVLLTLTGIGMEIYDRNAGVLDGVILKSRAKLAKDMAERMVGTAEENK